MYQKIRPLLFKLNPEHAHEITMHALQFSKFVPLQKFIYPTFNDETQLMGLTFPNKVGVAAGLDKNAIAIEGLANLGFGFLEVGTCTPKAQNGNAKPRLFRLVEDNAIINRMGFNNLGIDFVMKNVENAFTKAIIGVNIGKNLTTELDNAKFDYLIGLEKAYKKSDYVAINISSPNTKDLRSLQFGDFLSDLLQALNDKRKALQDIHQKNTPLAVKIAPDMNFDELKSVIDELVKYEIDCVIATNTTITRENLQSNKQNETGGLSGKPIFEKSTQIVREIYKHNPNLPIIASGGIFSGEDAKAKLAAGAKLVQLYTGFIYQGPKLIAQCAKACANYK